MEQQPNKDFDELFQKAAKEYPLKTDNKNWGAVSSKLNTLPSVLDNKKRKWQYAVLLLLLLSATFILVNRLNKSINLFGKQANQQPMQRDSSVSSQNNSSSKTIPTFSNNNSNSEIPHQSIALTKIAVSNSDEIVYHRSNISSQKINNPNTQTNLSVNSDLNGINEHATDNANKQSASSESPNNNNSTSQQYPPQKELKNVNPNNNSNQNLQGNKTTADAKKSVHINLQPHAKKFYGTIYFAPDFSSVKFQKLSKPGYIAGVSLGYRLTKRLSTEIGLQRMHNDFYSNGKYFDKSKSHLKPSYKIDALSGSNKLTEVPLMFHYRLSKNNDHFFAGAGTTLAIITHSEQYDYSIKKDGTEKNVSKDYSSLTHTKFFSSININAGYQTSLYNICNIKIEPFYQASLKGIGIGNLPINSFGVSIGLVKDLK